MPTDQLTYFTRARDCSMAAYTVHTDRRPRSYCGLACWTLNPASGQSYCSFNSHKNSHFALMKYTLRASAGMNTINEVIKICIHRILEQLVGTMNYFVCISVSEIYLETFHVWVTKTLLRPVHGAMICPKRRTLCSIIVSKQNFHFSNFEI